MNKTLAYGSTACNTYMFCYVEQGSNRSLLTDNTGTGDYLFDRGFTGHCLFRTGFGKHLDAFKLMNIASPDYEVSGNVRMCCLSRISGNPIFSRMLSPDPFIQDPSDNQTFNRYSYCLNNPLVYRDPSGYYSDYSSGGNGGYYINVFLRNKNIMRILILFCLVYSSKIFSQQVPETSIRWMNDNLKNTNVEPKELLTSYNKYDFSKIWLSYQRATIGFIGDNYQRFYIHFEKIIKNDTTLSYYLVKGKSKVDNNICDFEGEINILNIREINKQEREETLKDGKEKNDSDLINRAKYKQYMIIAEYELKENPNQKWSGIFKGILKSFFYISNGQVFYYDSNLEYSDSYSNNQFVGTWKSYNSTHEKKCCWGNFRIPCSGDLDIGDGEFSPNDKYLKNGWENYKKAYFEENKEAINKEQEKWWK